METNGSMIGINLLKCGHHRSTMIMIIIIIIIVRPRGASLPPLGSWVRISVTPCGFRGGRNGVWVGFSPIFPYHKFHSTISPHLSISFHFISPCDGASGMVSQHPCYSQTYNMGASSHLIPRPNLVLDTSWGYIYISQKLIYQLNWNFVCSL